MTIRIWPSSSPRGLVSFIIALIITIISMMNITIQAAATPTDYSPPVIYLTDSHGVTLRNDTVFDSGNITIVCLVIDYASEIKEVNYSADGSAVKAATSTGDMHRTSIRLTELSEGEHSITVRATNNANLTAEKTVNFTIDRTVAPSADQLIWNVLGVIVAVTGIAVALVPILVNRKKEPRPLGPQDWRESLPPIL